MFNISGPGSSKIAVPKTETHLAKSEQDYEDRVNKNLAKRMQNADLDKTVKESTVMHNLLR